MPAILAFSGYFFGSFIASEKYAYGMLLTTGLFFTFLTVCFLSVMISDKTTWCTTPGDMGQPIWWFLRNDTPMNINILWLIGMLIPIIFVDPLIIGTGIVTITGISAFIARQADVSRDGEWVSSAALLSNLVAFWAFISPYIRGYMFFPVQVHTAQIVLG